MSIERSSLYQRSGHPRRNTYTNVGLDELTLHLWSVLNGKIHGIAFSPVMDGQTNLSEVSETQIRARLDIIRSYTNWIRTFSCTTGNDQIPAIAKQSGLKTMVGAWIDDDLDNNEKELKNALNIVKQGHADILAIGNEVLLRDEMSEDDLITYIYRAKEQAGDVPVGYVDAYFKFEDHPKVVEACDILLVNCYPFWEKCPLEHALVYMKDMYHRAVHAAKGKKVVIAETGWPTRGAPFGAAVPSSENALKYFLDTYDWAQTDDIDIFYFAAFDEAWKVEKEGDVGAYWGLWHSDGSSKFK
ncbi:MAG: glycosyl hydrolase [Hyphomonadaceae bacterium]|nr:glycosyl hydrolase [Hyphomonadaceae bacterium]